MNLNGLSFDNIPRFGTPFRFFITAPIFGLLACLLILMSGPDLWLSRWQPSLIAITHLLTLGFMAMVMCGALMQVLPVLGGDGIPNVDQIAPPLHVILIFGLLLFPANFFWPSLALMLLSIIPLISALTVLLAAMSRVLIRKSQTNHSIQAIRFAVICLLLTMVSGAWQLSGYYWPEAASAGKLLTNIHLSQGLLGWVCLLIMGLSFQVIPMFHVTPEFAAPLQRWLPLLQFSSLMLISVAHFNQLELLQNFSLLLLTGCIGTWAISGLALLNRRKRKVPDSTVNFWRLAFISLLIAVFLFVSSLFVNSQWQQTIQLIAVLTFVAGFAMAVILGMMLKIISFLAFMHLQQAAISCFQAMSALPNMHELVPVNRGRWLLRSYLVTLPSLLVAPLFPLLTPLAVGLLAAVFLQLFLLQVQAWRKFKAAERKIESLKTEHGTFDLKNLKPIV